ncbi:MAG: 4-hydroxy-tetrahydrodipicolinate synthase [Holosporaceae bacterium]
MSLSFDVATQNHFDATKLHGVLPALSTPFKQGDKVDEKSFCAHLAFLKDAKVPGVVVAGTTGESLALSLEEKKQLFKLTRAALMENICIAGVACASLKDALKEAEVAQNQGMDALLVLPPYYVKADAKGLKDYFAALHQQTSCPLILYNNPSRLGFDLSPPLIQELTALPRVIGLKDASSDLSRAQLLCHPKNNWALLGGDDTTFAAFLAMQGQGLISVGANIAPHLYQTLLQAFDQNDLSLFKAVAQKLSALNQALAAHTNPKVIKYVLSLKGWGDGTLRIPLSPLSKGEKAHVEEVLTRLSLL